MVVVKEVTTQYGFKVDQGELDKVKKSMKSIAGLIAKVGAAGAAAAAGLFAFANETANAGDEAAKQSAIFGLSIGSYQELAHAVQQSGGEMANLTDVIKDVSKNALEATQGNEQFKAMFDELGVTLTDTEGNLLGTEDLLLQVADGMKGMTNEAKRLAISEKLLGGSGKILTNFFLAGSEGIAEMRQEARDLGIVLSDDVARQSEVFGDSIDEVGKALKGIRFAIGSAVMPMITKIAQGMRDWFIRNRELISQNLKAVLMGLASAFGLVWDAIAVVGKGLAKLVQWIGGAKRVIAIFKVVLLSLVAAKVFGGLVALVKLIRTIGFAFHWAAIKAALMQAAVFAIPLAIGALIAAVVLIGQDLYSFFTGGESMLGRIIKKIKEGKGWIGAVVRFIVGAAQLIWKVASWPFRMLIKFIKSAFDAVGGFLGGIATKINGIIGPIRDTIREAAEALGLSSTDSEQLRARGDKALGSFDQGTQSRLRERAANIAERSGGNVDIDQLAGKLAERRLSAVREGKISGQAAGLTANVGSVSVNVQGTTDMGPDQLTEAVKRGTSQGLADGLEKLQDSQEGGLA